MVIKVVTKVAFKTILKATFRASKESCSAVKLAPPEMAGFFLTLKAFKTLNFIYRILNCLHFFKVDHLLMEIYKYNLKIFFFYKKKLKLFSLEIYFKKVLKYP